MLASGIPYRELRPTLTTACVCVESDAERTNEGRLLVSDP